MYFLENTPLPLQGNLIFGEKYEKGREKEKNVKQKGGTTKDKG
jgi:hypothetical protein